MEKEIQEDDLIFKKGEATVVIDKLSIDYLQGAVIDYKESMIKSAFLVQENPNAELSCSCGYSFTPNSKI